LSNNHRGKISPNFFPAYSLTRADFSQNEIEVIPKFPITLQAFHIFCNCAAAIESHRLKLRGFRPLFWRQRTWSPSTPAVSPAARVTEIPAFVFKSTSLSPFRADHNRIKQMPDTFPKGALSKFVSQCARGFFRKTCRAVPSGSS
jgi:hypothetical protein